MTPLSYDPLDFAAEFSTEMCPEGVVAVSGEKLRIFGVERLGEAFNQAALPLRSVSFRFKDEDMCNNFRALRVAALPSRPRETTHRTLQWESS